MGRIFLSFVTLVMLSLFASCGKTPQVLTGLKVQTSHVENDIWLSLAADLNIGSMSLPAVTLPVIHPRTGHQVGSVELAPAAGAKNYIKLGVNLSELSDLRSQTAKLPNGNTIPLIVNNPTVVVPLGAGAQLYLTLSETVTAVGVAVPIKQFDAIGQNVGGINIFPVLNIDRVVGTAGLFTSRNAGQNGIALIADVSQYVKLQDIYVPSGSGASLIQAEQKQAASIKLDYRSQATSQSAQDRVNEMIYNLNQKKTKLQLHR